MTGSTSGTEASELKIGMLVTNTLEIFIVTGDFLPGERIVGQDSGSFLHYQSCQ